MLLYTGVMLRVRDRLRIEWGDCDPLGIMFYPNCFRWFDTGMYHLLDAAGISMPAVEKELGIVGFPLVDAGATFKSPLPWLTDIEIETFIEEWRKSSFVVKHLVWKGDVLAIDGREVRVCVMRSAAADGGLRSAEIPEAIKSRLAGEAA
ncbi:MAG TPA: acyl-CoA thioesterase [Alphaproteobacteria bacterium]